MATTPRTVYVFRRSADARAFSAAACRERWDRFTVLPMALGDPGDSPPAPELLRGCFSAYPTTYVNLLLGIDFLISIPEKLDALNLSLGPGSGKFDPEDPLQVATRCAYKRGVPVVVAAGNDGPADGTLQVLAQAPWTIAVGACDDRKEGHQLLDSSSRGIAGGRGPTVVSRGQPAVVYIDPERPQPDFKPGTSFAAANVAHLVVWIKKCLEIICADIRDVQQGIWSPESRPVGFAQFGIADTGVDVRALDPMPPEVSALLEAGKHSIVLPRDERRREWLSRWWTELERWGVTLNTKPNPALVERALQLMARPIPAYPPHAVGAGYVYRREVEVFLSNMTPVWLTALLFREMRLAERLALERSIEPELGPLWDAQFVQTTQTHFYFGQQLSVAKVM